MTITCCLVVPEGVVLGADSTITTMIGDKAHFMNHNQKIFEIGEESSLGIMTWGLTAFNEVSFRTLIAKLADSFGKSGPKSVIDVANKWSELALDAYKKAFPSEIKRYHDLKVNKNNRDTNLVKRPTRASKEEDREIEYIEGLLSVGFCIAGHVPNVRMPEAYVIELEPKLISQPISRRIGGIHHFGKDDVISRIFGVYDDEIKESITNSPFWSGNKKDLDKILKNLQLTSPPMTIRDAIDFVHFSIYSTIKATKFSTRDNDCGGPIEIAVITTDRKFRWVKHKTWDSAIDDRNP